MDRQPTRPRRDSNPQPPSYKDKESHPTQYLFLVFIKYPTLYPNYSLFELRGQVASSIAGVGSLASSLGRG